jgi:hypothetical protein
VGLLLLLNNFLLLGDFNVSALWPLLLVIAGAAILLRGDLTPSDEGRTFGITRGSVESAALAINAGEIDVVLRPLQREGRLIAGQYAAGARPYMRVTDTHTVLRMDRAATAWLSFADWEMALARDLPWSLYISTHLGRVNADLSRIIVQQATIATGFGDIRLTCPSETFGTINLRSALGSIHIITPVGCRARITAPGGRFFKVYADSVRYDRFEADIYAARDADPHAPVVEIVVTGTFGDAYLT